MYFITGSETESLFLLKYEYSQACNPYEDFLFKLIFIDTISEFSWHSIERTGVCMEKCDKIEITQVILSWNQILVYFIYLILFLAGLSHVQCNSMN